MCPRRNNASGLAADTSAKCNGEQGQGIAVSELTRRQEATKESDSEYLRRRREVEKRVKEARAKQQEEEEERRRTPTHTGLPPGKVPQRASIIIPVFGHGERTHSGKARVSRAMTMAKLKSMYGEEYFTAVGNAFYNLFREGGVLEGLDFVQCMRRGLGIYLIGIPLDQFSEEDLFDLANSFFEGGSHFSVLATLLDPAHIREELPNVRIAYSYRHTKERSSTGEKFVKAAFVLVLSDKTDIWHTCNRSSPGNQQYLKRIRHRLPKQQATLEDEAEDVELEEEDESASFEDVLQEEKQLGQLLK